MNAHDPKLTTFSHLSKTIEIADKQLACARLMLKDGDKIGAIKYIDMAIKELGRKQQIIAPVSKTEYFGEEGEVRGVRFVLRDGSETLLGECVEKF